MSSATSLIVVVIAVTCGWLSCADASTLVAPGGQPVWNLAQETVSAISQYKYQSRKLPSDQERCQFFLSETCALFAEDGLCSGVNDQQMLVDFVSQVTAALKARRGPSKNYLVIYLEDCAQQLAPGVTPGAAAPVAEPAAVQPSAEPAPVEEVPAPVAEPAVPEPVAEELAEPMVEAVAEPEPEPEPVTEAEAAPEPVEEVMEDPMVAEETTAVPEVEPEPVSEQAMEVEPEAAEAAAEEQAADEEPMETAAVESEPEQEAVQVEAGQNEDVPAAVEAVPEVDTQAMEEMNAAEPADDAVDFSVTAPAVEESEDAASGDESAAEADAESEADSASDEADEVAGEQGQVHGEPEVNQELEQLQHESQMHHAAMMPMPVA